jgi:hypothetical protein
MPWLAQREGCRDVVLLRDHPGALLFVKRRLEAD